MAYSKNPHLPRVRRDAADLVRRGWGVRKVARYIGVYPGTITKWVRKAKTYGYHPIPTLSSVPKHHPAQLSANLVQKIVHKRLEVHRSAEVVHRELINEGIAVSLSSVKRTLDRSGLLKKRSPWKRYHPPFSRPNAEKQGDLVQIDTLHMPTPEGRRVYVYTPPRRILALGVREGVRTRKYKNDASVHRTGTTTGNIPVSHAPK